MSLEKKDVRAWLSPEAHAVAKALANRRNKEVNEFVSSYLENKLLSELDDAKLLVDAAGRAGRCRDLPDSPGAGLKGHSRRQS